MPLFIPMSRRLRRSKPSGWNGRFTGLLEIVWTRWSVPRKVRFQLCA